jgi:hypothetical protein
LRKERKKQRQRLGKNYGVYEEMLITPATTWHHVPENQSSWEFIYFIKKMMYIRAL